MMRVLKPLLQRKFKNISLLSKIQKVLTKDLYSSSHFEYLNLISKPFSLKENYPLSQEIWKPLYVYVPLQILKASDEVMTPVSKRCLKYIQKRETPFGAFATFPQENPNIVNQFAVVSLISSIGTEEAYLSYNRTKLYHLLSDLKHPSGAFRASYNDGFDLRSTFASVLLIHIFNINDQKLLENVIAFTLKCQTYEGGFSGNPFGEAHGGFTFCALSILKLTNSLNCCNLNSLLRWIAMQQSEFSGGFHGRTNKLVDSCYSFWIGFAAKTVSDFLSIPLVFDFEQLSSFLLSSCQNHKGGFRDSPPNNVDPFHTLFGLCGLNL